MTADKRKNEYWERRRLGLCAECGKVPSLPNRYHCQSCRDIRRGLEGTRRKKHIEAGMCNRCGKCPPVPGRRSCQYCREVQNRRIYKLKDPVYRDGAIARSRNARRVQKCLVLTHYGPDGVLGCSWPGCVVNDLDMLSLDHVKGGGCRHRREIGADGKGHGGKSMYQWIIKHGFPAGYQTLCFNHQMKKELSQVGLRKSGP